MIANTLRYEIYEVNDTFNFLISKSIYEEFEEEMTAILTAFKLLDYGLRITVYKNKATHAVYRFTHKYENKGCSIRFETTWTGVIKEVEVGVREVLTKRVVNHQFQGDIIGSLRAVRECIPQM